MSRDEEKISWIKRVEELVKMLEGTSIGELELHEAGLEIIIRRRPEMRSSVSPIPQVQGRRAGVPLSLQREAQEDQSDRLSLIAPLAGVYYASPSPTTPPYLSVGDIVQVGQVVALIETMKIFHEVQAEVSGRVVAHVAINGDVVQKGDVLLQLEPE